MHSLRSNSSKKITMIIPNLGPGGAERSLVLIANELASRGFLVSVITYLNEIPDCFDLEGNVARVKIDLGPNKKTFFFRLVNFIRRISLLRKSITETKPDIILSFLERTNELVLMASIFSPAIKIASFQNDLRFHKVDGKLGDLLRRLTYPMADKVVFLDKEQANWSKSNFSFWSATGIPNPVVPPDLSEAPPFSPQQLTGRSKTLITMGRLVDQKGFDLLIEAFANIANEVPDWSLIVLGEGELRSTLETQIERVNLSDRIFLPGVIKNPSRLLSLCDLFVFSSRYEGQGMALIEAMTCGLPAVSFDCDSGPRMIVNQEVDGLLVPNGNVKALGEALKRLMRNDAERMRMSKKAREIEQKYSVGSIVDEWVGLFHSSQKAK